MNEPCLEFQKSSVGAVQVDTAFVGRLGVLQLAALGPNGALFNVVFFLGFSALGVVATNQISAAHGASDQRAAGRSLILSSTVAFLLGELFLHFAIPISEILSCYS